MKTTGKRNRDKGFALVVTLTLMILLTVVAVGLLSLSSISLRTTGRTDQLSAARANARLALMIAIGDLQKYAGPDRRVTAPSSLLASGSGSTVANNSWVGVWRTDDATGSEAASKPVVRPNASTLFDARTAKAFDTKGRVLGWLVSGDNVDPEVTLDAKNSVQMRSGTQAVRAPLVPVTNSRSGRMAYWASDESTKAKVNLADPLLEQQPAFANTDAYRRLVAPLSLDMSVMFRGATTPDVNEAYKLVTTQQVALSKVAAGLPQGQARQELLAKADDFTVHSRSVLSDPVKGGLKKDLTAYLEDGEQADLGTLSGIADADGIIDEALPNRTMAGPKFGMLRNWYALRNQVSGSLGDRQIADQQPNTYGTSFGKIVDPGQAFIKPLIQPIMAEAVYYQRHVLNPGTNPGSLVELIYPRVVLWNPFNVKLQTSGHVVHFDIRAYQKIAVTSTAGVKADFGINTNYTSNMPKHLGFYIPPTTFEPGESLCFTAGGSSKVTPITDGDSDLRSNVLSATENPASLKCFSRVVPPVAALPAGFNMAGAKVSYDGNSGIIYNGSARTQTVALHALSGSRSAVKTTDLLSASGPPVVRQISLDNYSRDNNGRWMVGYTPPRTYTLSEASAGIAPDSLLAFGARFRYLYETYANRVQGKSNKEPWFGSPLVDNNIGAPNIHRWPMDNAFGLSYANSSSIGISGSAGNGPHLYSYGPTAQARQWSEWLDPEVLAHRTSSGNYRTSVFTDASFSNNNSTYPIYDLPSKSVPLASLGALQHVQLSPFAWHPTLTIGQSFPSPYLPDSSRNTAVTSRTASSENALWGKVQYLSSSNYDITGFDKISNRGTKDILFNDLSYEVNEALWDRFFLSAIPRSGTGSEWNGSKWSTEKPLPNPRLTINEFMSNGGSKDELTSFYRAARSLWLEGGFNVNSTSIPAWESMLRAFRGIEVPSRSGSNAAASGTPYAGTQVPEGGASPAVAPTDDRFWNAYRELSDDDIHQLATQVVAEVHQRGPFLGVSDFVNRRLVPSNDAKRAAQANGGTLQAAIDRVDGLNEATQAGWLMPMPKAAASDYTYGATYWGAPIQTPEPQNYNGYLSGETGKPKSEGTGAAGHINQGDILQQIGSILVARGDTFVVRGYGEALDKSGNVTARAMCEAVVQRTPQPITPDTAVGGLNPMVPQAGAPEFGRQFQIESFRWLNPEEV